MWTTVLPLVLAIGWAEVAGRLVGRLEAPAPLRSLAATAVVVALVVPSALLAARLTTGFRNLPSPVVEQYDPDSRQAWDITRSALAGKRPQPIVIDITESDRIPLAAGIALQLKKAGWDIQVNKDWNYIFGPDSVINGGARLELVLVDPKEKATWDSRLPDKQPIGATTDTLLYLRPLYPGVSP